ncbi:exopolysaccharide biosynthesis polyprenyl glycosylphosphotransferase [Ruminococcus sp. YE71]|uniref:exopolysaccharide biosynthesis polyprenyl glycosylphosphotransferase n=1 Tax=unclassified Ruminococcus TaxID=2608920 RepID=UPI0008875D08|nr:MULTISPECIES: exopolysaccharide biosynthesis polyprenyl glycosylphosphotransferase [unclassified Ruminococcus]SDA29424.1 exopolysaccharide biosynthesis polyprenyl glycosylphosphotransferase [Ruminococcus sp. YE78]SFW48258.1 exopolysaccharide biosynthesis polyprenyl glycosylphosphotransferase [Ruminococcus sp. YE71]
MKNKEQFKRLLKFIAAIIIITLFAYSFFLLWIRQYNQDMKERFFYYGNVLMEIMYIFVYAFSANSFSAFRVGYYRVPSLIGSQTLGILMTNAITFVEISLISHGRLSPVPIIRLTAWEIAIAAVWALLFTKLYSNLYPPRKMLIVYGNSSANALVRKMCSRVDKYIINESISCDESIDRIKERILAHEAVVISDIPSQMKNQLVKFTFENDIRTYINPKLSDILVRGADECNLFDTPLLLCRNDGLSADQAVIKRTLDIFLSLVLIILTSPFMIGAAIAIKAYDKGPVLYKQQRLTIGGRKFYVYKFRSMIVNAEKNGAQLADKHDDRITPVGRIIRRIRFDELPQLFNILKGDMSFVGPRPERPELAEKYENSMPEFRFRLKVKAGLTGYAQVMGKYNTTPYDKLKLDLMYIERQSLRLDLKLMLMTVKIIFVPDSTEGVDGEMITTRREQHSAHTNEEIENILK